MADARAVREPRRRSSASTHQNPSKTSREFYNCTSCRIDGKKCVDVEGKYQCQRCINRDRPCGPRQRKHATPESWDTHHEYCATITAGLILLFSSVRQCLKASTVLYPFPYFTLDNRGAFARSQALGDSLEILASRMQIQMWNINQMIDWLHVEMISVWNRVDTWNLGRTVFFHPSRATEPVSTVHAEVVASGIRFVPQACGIHFPHFNLDIQMRIDGYRKIAWNLENLLQQSIPCLTKIDQSLVRIHHGIPACIIAYFNGDRDAALQLWHQATMALDILGRTLVHIVVEQSDLTFLQRMAVIDPRALDCGRDLRGLTPFAIATYTGCIDCFEFMLDVCCRMQGSGPQRNIDFSWLHLAMASGSAHIVNRIVDIGYAMPPYQRDISTAIQLGRGDMTSSMLHWLFHGDLISRVEVQELLGQAEWQLIRLRKERDIAANQGWVARVGVLEEWLQQMQKLATSLRVRQIVRGNPEDAVGSLQGMGL